MLHTKAVSPRAFGFSQNICHTAVPFETCWILPELNSSQKYLLQGSSPFSPRKIFNRKKAAWACLRFKCVSHKDCCCQHHMFV